MPTSTFALWYDPSYPAGGWCREMTGSAADCIRRAEQLYTAGVAVDFVLLPPTAGPDAIGARGSHVLDVGDPTGPRLDPPLAATLA